VIGIDDELDAVAEIVGAVAQALGIRVAG
jgi:hypothetical protein